MQGIDPAPPISDPVQVTPAPSLTPAAQVIADDDATGPAQPLPIDTPALCGPGLVLVEDGSCVPPTFFQTPATLVAPLGLMPCADEDGPGPCYWDASTRGNGIGSSFLIDQHGMTWYLAG